VSNEEFIAHSHQLRVDSGFGLNVFKSLNIRAEE